jgi:hypothetical protein
MRKLRLKLESGSPSRGDAVLITVAVGNAAFASLILWAMRQPPETF